MRKPLKKIIYIDLDNTIVDFKSGIDACTQEELDYYKVDEIPGIFSRMKPREYAIACVKALCLYFDVYILTTAPWNNPSAWSDKFLWIQKYFGDELKKKLDTSHEIAAVKNIRLESDTLKLRCLDEIADYEMAHQPTPPVSPVEPPQGKDGGEVPPQVQPAAPKVKKRKNVSTKLKHRSFTPLSINQVTNLTYNA